MKNCQKCGIEILKKNIYCQACWDKLNVIKHPVDEKYEALKLSMERIKASLEKSLLEMSYLYSQATCGKLGKIQDHQGSVGKTYREAKELLKELNDTTS